MVAAIRWLGRRYDAPVHPFVVPICLGGAFVMLVLHLWGIYRGPRALVYVAKPLTIVFLIALVAIAPVSSKTYRTAVLIGLVLSLLGDIFLMLPRDRFLAGLAAFALAHCAYIVAFCVHTRFAARPLLFLPYAIVAVIVMRLLGPRIAALRVPIVIYVVILATMASQALIRASMHPWPAAVAAATGAALFVVSDATLAIDRFRGSFRSAQAIVMVTYTIAQALIAVSIG